MGKKANDLTGRQFGCLSVTGLEGLHGVNRRWRCTCTCGKEVLIWQSNLLSGRTQSCGCQRGTPADRHYVDGTCLEMIASKTISRSNTSGVRGVYWKANRGKWAAQITFRGKTLHLGLFDSLERAAAARAEAEQRYFAAFLEQHASQNG